MPTCHPYSGLTLYSHIVAQMQSEMLAMLQQLRLGSSAAVGTPFVEVTKLLDKGDAQASLLPQLCVCKTYKELTPASGAHVCTCSWLLFSWAWPSTWAGPAC